MCRTAFIGGGRERLRRVVGAALVGARRVELAAAGGSTVVGRTEAQVDDVLTPQEIQVVRRAGRGMSNTEIALTLYMSQKTVEAHLTRTYRKLGVRSRTQLANVLFDQGLLE